MLAYFHLVKTHPNTCWLNRANQSKVKFIGLLIWAHSMGILRRIKGPRRRFNAFPRIPACSKRFKALGSFRFRFLSVIVRLIRSSSMITILSCPNFRKMATMDTIWPFIKRFYRACFGKSSLYSQQKVNYTFFK